ncbi:MAG: dihydroneopterin aldolase [Armatimonadetes bacterium]|nr:dihydroneopterin aldolase [Armatimonadota bacterium]
MCYTGATPSARGAPRSAPGEGEAGVTEREAPDKIIVHGIQFYGFHGVPDEEQAVGHRYAVDLELSLDLSRAGESDSIADTVNYAHLARLVVEIGTTRRFRLLEALAEQIAAAVRERAAPQRVRVRVKKLLPPANGIIDYAAVEIVRSDGAKVR